MLEILREIKILSSYRSPNGFWCPRYFIGILGAIGEIAIQVQYLAISIQKSVVVRT